MDLEEQYEKLLKYCCMKLKDRDLAEDIVQESFLKFWKAKNYHSMGKEMAYLYTIARNLMIDYFKKRKDELPGDEEIEQYVDLEQSDMEKDITNKILVDSAMAKLSEQNREIIALFFVSELSATDIGKILGISRFAVHRRLKSSKEILKNELEGCL